jgi:hypothetical protein
VVKYIESKKGYYDDPVLNYYLIRHKILRDMYLHQKVINYPGLTPIQKNTTESEIRENHRKTQLQMIRATRIFIESIKPYNSFMTGRIDYEPGQYALGWCVQE